jgi:LAO/AO transport system kinase
MTPELWNGFLKGDRISCARVISLLENEPDSRSDVLDRLYPLRKGATRIGITGPPGVGKSTVTAALTKEARSADHTVGIIAVDPTSPFSGGAFLGDRIRMNELTGDEGVFIRSMASREGHGGLSPSTPYVADVFDAFGMDMVFIETVGVGQAEIDVLTCADIIVVVLQPSTGDTIQALKAGILEAADMFLVNKADLPGADMVQESLRFMLEMDTRREDQHLPPILAVSARNDTGMDEAFAQLMQVIERLGDAGRFLAKRKERIEREVIEAMRKILYDDFLAKSGARDEIEQFAVRCAESNQSPFPFIRELSSRVKMEPRNDGKT